LEGHLFDLQEESDMVQVDTCAWLQSMKCAEKDDVKMHLTSIMVLCEELKQAWVHLLMTEISLL